MDVVEDVEVGVVDEDGAAKKAADALELLSESRELVRLSKQLLGGIDRTLSRRAYGRSTVEG